MEEPPRACEVHPVHDRAAQGPATIQSRCQRFDFRAIPSSKIAEQIRHILKEEGIKADAEVVAEVARLGNGSMRDALSILDRLLAGGQDTLTVEHLEEMLGLPDHDLIMDWWTPSSRATQRRAQGRQQLLQRSAGVEQALELLTDHLRNLMMIAACGGEAEFLDLSDEIRAAEQGRRRRLMRKRLVHMIAICDACRELRGFGRRPGLFDAAMVHSR